MLFGSTVKIAQNTEAFAVKIQNNILEQVNSFKYLGVYLDSKNHGKVTLLMWKI